MKRNPLLGFHRVIVLIGFIILSFGMSAQNITAKGVVVDENGVPAIGVSVVVKGTTNGTATDIDGQFSLSAPKGATLVISYVGYQTQEVVASTNMNITLAPDNELLDEVVVIGYGTVRKADLAGAVSVLDNKNFKDQPITQVSDALQGRVAGVMVQSSGVPGGDVKIRIRGANSVNNSNDPLYVVDGIVRESGLNGINPEDIQSMQILKDASSTAIYGSRGSNGVVLITTKKGKSGGRDIIFDASFGASSLYKEYKLMDAATYAQALTEYGKASFTQEEMNAYKNGTAGVNWQDEIFRTGITSNYKLSISSGNDKTQYYLSGNYAKQEGVVLNSSHERYQTKLNVNSQVTDWFGVTADVNASHSVAKGGAGGASKDNPIWLSLVYSPTMEIMDNMGNYLVDPYNSIDRNPLGILTLNNSERMFNIFNGRIDLKFKLADGLTFTSTNGIDYFDMKSYSFTSKRVSLNNNQMSNSNNYRMMLQSSNNLTYMKTWNDKHNLTATAVYEVTESESRNMSISGSALQTESVGWWNVGVATSKNAGNGYSRWALMSGVGRVMYNYDDRYMLIGTIRADGTSRFAKTETKNNKWGYFPSIAAAWTLSNEPFMKDVNAIQDIKLRASYGIVGSQNIAPYATISSLGSTSYDFGTSSDYTGYWESKTVNRDITWEKTNQYDLGIDFSLLNRRLTVGLDYFNKYTTGALLSKPIPDYLGGGSFSVNEGAVSNKGVELSLNANILQTDDWSWNSTLNASYLTNKVEKLANEKEQLFGNSPAAGAIDYATVIMQGQPIGTFWGYEWTGLDSNGNNTYTDLNNDGKIDGSDRMVIGKSNPDFTFGWNNTLSYKNWDFNCFFNAMVGAKKLNLMHYFISSSPSVVRFITLEDAYLKGFDKGGDFYATMKGGSQNYQGASTQWLEDASYLRLENISLSYNLSKKVSKIADFRFTLSAQNLFTLTNYKGMDPAAVSFHGTGNVDNNAGIDMGAFPTPRTFTFGVRMNF